MTLPGGASCSGTDARPTVLTAFHRRPEYSFPSHGVQRPSFEEFLRDSTMAKARTSSGAVAALDYLVRSADSPPRPVCVVFGDEPFLKSEVLAALRSAVLADEDAEFSSREFVGEETELRTVLDEVSTVGLFGGGGRLVIVRQADKGRRRAAAKTADQAAPADADTDDDDAADEASPSSSFVSRNRQALEDYVARPSNSGVLVLEVTSWPSNTRLYKQIAAAGLQIDCNVPDGPLLLKWLRDRAARNYQASFAAGAAERLLEIVGPHMGGLDQETAKLALLAAPAVNKASAANAPDAPSPPAKSPAVITPQLIDESVGGWRAKVAWDMIDAAADGKTSEALAQLDRLILAGEHPVALMGQIAWRFRQLAAAARIVAQEQSSGRRANLRGALQEVGVKPWQGAMDRAVANLRQLGPRRAGKLYRWLLEADVALKGSSSAPDRARLVIEQFFARLSRQLSPSSAGAR